MEKEDYNKLSTLYQILTNRFFENYCYHHHGSYRCFDRENIAVREPNLTTLLTFKKICFKDVYTPDYIKQQNIGKDFIELDLVRFENDHVCIIYDIEVVLFYLIVDNLKNEISDFYNSCTEYRQRDEPSQSENSAEDNEEKDGENVIVTIPYDVLENLQNESVHGDSYKIMLHFLIDANSHLVKRYPYAVEVNLSRIESILDNLENFNFSNVPI